jgi:SAM-dependent methyltransferase
MKGRGIDRVRRERDSYDGGVWERCNEAQRRFRHVFLCPNTQKAERFVEDLLRARSPGKHVLEIGCARGDHALKLLSYGAEHVLGLDIVPSFLRDAGRRAVPGRLEFANQDIMQPLQGSFDVIFGGSILHHIDFRPVLTRLYEWNLLPGGLMVFREPLGSNWLMRLWWWWGKAAHTPDERPLWREDLRWLEQSFPRIEILPVNYFSFAAGIVSSVFCESPDNLLTRWADRLDCRLARQFPCLRHRFRHAVIVIEKPAS